MPATPVARWRTRVLGSILLILAALAIGLAARTPNARAESAPVKAHTAIANTFGADMFGVAAGGDLQNEAPATLGHDLSDDADAGARWIRVDINWAQIQAAGPQSYDWTSLDAVVKRSRALGISVLGTIDYTPGWARPADAPATWAPKPALYARFAAAAAAHLKGQVSAFEIWNEENTTAFFAPHPAPARYTAMLRAAYTAIKHVDPSVTVVSGGLAPAPNGQGSISPVSFLKAIYAHGGKGYFNAVGDHPYCWPDYPGTPDAWSAWYQMYGTHASLRSVMVAHGNAAKKIWATEFGAPTGGPHGSYVSDATQAKMVRRAYDLFASYDWAGPLFLYQGRDAGDRENTIENFFGFINHNFTPKPAFRVYRELSATL